MAKLKTYSIEARSDDKYKVEVTSGNRTFYVDQPVFVGGTDTGANPMEYLFSSLAGCIATTSRIIANQRKLNLKGMDIKIEGALDLDIIYGKSRDGRPGVNSINVSLVLDSEMSEIERKSFYQELQLRCPIVDTIAAVTPITLAVE